MLWCVVVVVFGKDLNLDSVWGHIQELQSTFNALGECASENSPSKQWNFSTLLILIVWFTSRRRLFCRQRFFSGSMIMKKHFTSAWQCFPLMKVTSNQIQIWILTNRTQLLRIHYWFHFLGSVVPDLVSPLSQKGKSRKSGIVTEPFLKVDFY